MNVKNIPFGQVDKFNVFIEIPEVTQNKYEYDEELEMVRLDFVLSGEAGWPFNYGFICGTRGGDGDMLDAIILSSQPLTVGTLVVCRAVGMAEIVDRGEVDNKILCVPVVDRLMEKYQNIDSFSEEQLRSYNDFFIDLAVQKNKIMEVKGFGDKERAEQEINRSIEK